MSIENEQRKAATTEMVQAIRPDLDEAQAAGVAEIVMPSAMEAAETRQFDDERIAATRAKVAEFLGETATD